MSEQDHSPKDGADAVYTLHYFPFSLYSLMSRFGIVLGKSLNPASAPNVEIKLVNLQENGNLTEEYLTTVNSRGQVPTLTSPALPAVLNESRDIANWLCEQQPELLPEEHKDVIDKGMAKFFSYHAKALNIPADGIPNKAAAMLENPNITEGHRRALEIKSIFHDTLHSRTVEPDHIANVEQNTKEFMEELAEILQQRQGDDQIWLFGDKPTILDAFALPFVARMIDVERTDLVPEITANYARKILKTPEWEQVTHGRSTVLSKDIGKVKDLSPL